MSMSREIIEILKSEPNKNEQKLSHINAKNCRHEDLPDICLIWGEGDYYTGG